MPARSRPPLRTVGEIRLEQHMTLPELADRAHVSRGTLSMIERGRMVATAPERERLAAVLGLRPLENRMQVIYEEPS